VSIAGEYRRLNGQKRVWYSATQSGRGRSGSLLG